jgi:hypothetical protein
VPALGRLVALHSGNRIRLKAAVYHLGANALVMHPADVPLDKPRLYVDFNEMADSDLVLLSVGDTNTDARATVFATPKRCDALSSSR